ncbi:MAG: fasciclin domain-containing protein [Caulobacterales bacterium]
MNLNRLLTTAAAAALIALPAIAFAAGEAPAAPAADTASAAAPAPAATPAPPSIPHIAGGADLYETAKASGQFTILVKALDSAGLKAVLKGNPNLTLFAPTDDAFKALPPDQLTKLMLPDNANQLQQILAYHLIAAPVDSSQIKGHKGPATTAEKSAVTLDGSNPNWLMVNNADIVQADVRTSNGGVLHAIDKVLVPSDSPFAATLAPSAPSASAPAAATPSGG